MRILCDTCSVLMVIRIAPEMFIDPKFGCATIPMVHNEIFKKQEFKTKYPWRDQYKSKIKTIGYSVLNTPQTEMNLTAIHALVTAGVMNTKTGFLVDLSLTDKQIIACASANQYDITSGDKNLVDFAEQQFDISNISPLGLVNDWLEGGLVHWDQQLQMVIEDWDKCGEMAQPVEEAGRYQKLTGKFYVGP